MLLVKKLKAVLLERIKNKLASNIFTIQCRYLGCVEFAIKKGNGNYCIEHLMYCECCGKVVDVNVMVNGLERCQRCLRYNYTERKYRSNGKKIRK